MATIYQCQIEHMQAVIQPLVAQGNTLSGPYSAAGIALPSCTTTIKGMQAYVSDATTPTYNGTYASGGAIYAAVFCNGSNWITH